eukprot:gene5584-5823_t
MQLPWARFSLNGQEQTVDAYPQLLISAAEYIRNVCCCKDSSLLQVSGEAAYTDDSPLAANALFAAYVTSSRALAKIVSVDWSPAMDVTGADVDKALASSCQQLEGQLLVGSQRHFYMEPQTAVAAPVEGDRLAVVSSCQGVDQVLWVVAELLQLKHNQVTVTANRVGGGFGGKECGKDALLAVHDAKATQLVRLVVATAVDGSMNAGRCPMTVNWWAGLDPAGALTTLKMEILCTVSVIPRMFDSHISVTC